MKLVFIYGPPASGKLTTAEEVAALTGFGVFHNHLTVDLARVLFEIGTEAFERLRDRLRLDTFRVAVNEGLAGLTFTFVYRLTYDDDFVKQVIALIESGGGQACFVQLTCTPEKQEERVVSEARQRFRKIVTVEQLRHKTAGKDYSQRIPFAESLSIDNSNVDAREVARRIVKHFGLPIWVNSPNG